jgi:hypothetical protein
VCVFNFLRVVTHENCTHIKCLGGRNMSAIETALQACVDANGQCVLFHQKSSTDTFLEIGNPAVRNQKVSLVQVKA